MSGKREAVITLTARGLEKSFTLTGEQDGLTVGRRSGCNIPIDDVSVSGRHGRLFWDGDRFYYTDLNSTNGSFIEGKPLRGTVPVKDGAVIAVAGAKSEVTLKIALTGQVQETALPGGTDSGGKNILLIGRDASCDVVLPYHNVSRFHAKLTKRDGAAWLEDNGSTNGTFVNGRHADSPCKITAESDIYIASVRLYYVNGKLVREGARAGLSVQVRDLRRAVTEKGREKTLLDKITLSIEANEFVAIIGGSGAGKSTFMNVLCGKTGSAAYTGMLTYNRSSAADSGSVFKSAIGYAPQNDVLYRDLTLRQMLYYSAKLKMPQDTTREEYEKRVGQVIGQVALTGHENTLVKSLSGGQQKRASIAVELLSDPKLFFLDEPTSGLDPATERNLMRMLKEMTKDNKTIIAVTHVTQNLNLCDKVVVLGAGGRLCFFGAPEDCCAFFGVTDIVDIYDKVNGSPAEWQQKFKEAVPENTDDDVVVTKRESAGKARKDKKTGYSSGWNQFLVLSARYTRLVVSDVKRLLLLLLQAPLLGVLLMLVSVSSLEDGGVLEFSNSAKSTLFSLTCAAFWVGMLNSIQEICKEKDIFERERMSAVKLLPYIASKIVVIGALCIFQSFILVLVVSLFAALPENAFGIPPFLGYFASTCLTTVCAACLGLAVSSLSPNPDRAMAIAPIILLPQILFSGIVFTLKDFTNYISNVIPCKLTMQSLGILTNLNDIFVAPDSEEKLFDAIYSTTDMSRLSGAWQGLIISSVVYVVIFALALKLKAKE